MLVAGRYRLGELLGRGPLGEVFEAVDQQTGGAVAVKLLAPGHGARQVSRFVLEASTLQALHSPLIVEVLDVGEEQGRPFVVMERLRGEDLRSRSARGPLPLQQIVEIGRWVAEGLEVAHAAGVVHRDIKPANIFLLEPGLSPAVKLLDFGSAKVIAGSLGARPGEPTKPGDLVGSPRYMSPEQARGKPTIDGRSDIFSLGMVLYELLAGRHPYADATGLADLIMAICTEPPLPLTLAAPNVPASLAKAIDRAVAHDPRARFASVAELRAALLVGP